MLELAKGNKQFAAIDRAIGKDSFRVVLLLRLSPLLPLALSNYLYGLTSVDLVPYVLGSWVGMLPGTLAYVTAGEIPDCERRSVVLPGCSCSDNGDKRSAPGIAGAVAIGCLCDLVLIRGSGSGSPAQSCAVTACAPSDKAWRFVAQHDRCSA